MSKPLQSKTIRHKRWELRKGILEVIILGIISGGGSPLKPTLPLMMETIIKLIGEDRKLAFEEKKIRRVINSLEKQEILTLVDKGDSIHTYILNNKHPSVITYSIKSLLEFRRREKKWKGKWYAIFFDIPEIQRNKRDYLRKFLKKLGFYPYQKSVYLFPYECEEEISLIKKIVSGAAYMKYAIIEKIEDEDKLKNFFNL